MNRIITSLLLLLITSVSFAQITVTNTQTPQQLIEDVLIGSGVTPMNILVNGSAPAATVIQPNGSYFNQGATSFPIPEGVLLTSGAGYVAVGPNDAGGADDPSGTSDLIDADLDAIAANTVYNGIIIEFDFVATGDELQFNYVFASEEYPEFAPPNSSSFNDVFGFFLAGPGLAGPYTGGAVNLAVIPGTSTPISINNVNAVTNAGYYVDNEFGATYGTAIQYDGTTTVLTAFSELVCGETYHMKFAICNVGDQAWDSGVFLEGGSFSVNPVDFTFDTYTVDNTIYEECEQLGTLMFTRQGCDIDLGATLTAYLTYGGEAENSVDYETLADSVFFDVGVDTIYWQIVPIPDGLDEGIESIEITLMTVNNLGDTVYSSGLFYISDNPELTVTGQDSLLYCVSDSIIPLYAVYSGIEPLSYMWSTGDTTASSIDTLTENGVYYYVITVTDVCGSTAYDSLSITVDQTLHLDTMIQTPATCIPTGSVFAQISGYVGIPDVMWAGPNDPESTNTVDATAWGDLSPGWYYFTASDEYCTINDSIMVEVDSIPQALLFLDPEYSCETAEVVFSNESQFATSFYWNFGNGAEYYNETLDDVSQYYVNDATIYLVASNGIPACNDTAYVNVYIVECGCTDTSALNYDSLAVLDNGTCLYPPPPTPAVSAPNVFTPNVDDINAFFELTTENVEFIEIEILNRWGNLVYSGSGDIAGPPKWDGRLPSGKNAEDGVYFYKYRVRGIDQSELEGHGFVHVIR